MTLSSQSQKESRSKWHCLLDYGEMARPKVNLPSDLPLSVWTQSRKRSQYYLPRLASPSWDSGLAWSMRQVEGCEKVEGRGRWESDCPLHSRSMTTTTICSKTSKQQLFLGTGEVVRRSSAKVSLRYLASPSLQDPEVDMTMMIFNEGVLQGKQGGRITYF